MELLLLNNGEAQKGSGVSSTPDGSLTDLGMKQSCSVSAWLNYHFNLSEFKAFTSPYMRTLQTASILSEVIQMDFEVEQLLREFSSPVQPFIQIANRSILFQNLNWPVAEWTEKSNFYSEETIDSAVDRMNDFYKGLINKELEKVFVVSHAMPILILTELANNKTKGHIKEKINLSLKSDDSLDKLALQQMYGGMKDSGLTWIDSGETKWFSKTVF